MGHAQANRLTKPGIGIRSRRRLLAEIIPLRCIVLPFWICASSNTALRTDANSRARTERLSATISALADDLRSGFVVTVSHVPRPMSDTCEHEADAESCKRVITISISSAVSDKAQVFNMQQVVQCVQSSIHRRLMLVLANCFNDYRRRFRRKFKNYAAIE